MTTSCMGGFCLKRARCRLYANTTGTTVAERLCEPGKTDSFEPIRVRRAIGEWERPHSRQLAPAQWHEPIAC